MSEQTPESQPNSNDPTVASESGAPAQPSEPTPTYPGTYGSTPPPPQWGQQPTSTPPPHSSGQYGLSGQYQGGQYQNFPPPPAGYAYAPTQDDPGAQNAMIVGIVSVVAGFACGLGFFGSPFALVMGLRSKRRIAASGGNLGGAGNAQAGFVLGIVGTVLLALMLLVIMLWVVLLISSLAWFGETSTHMNELGTST